MSNIYDTHVLVILTKSYLAIAMKWINLAMLIVAIS